MKLARTRLFNRVVFGTAMAIGCATLGGNLQAASVWKVTSTDGHSLYLGGSFHALRPTDYPLPGEYNRAFDACSRLAFEEDPKSGKAAFEALMKAGEYAKSDSLKNHVDPRTYAYLRKFFQSMGVPEAKFSRYRPWLLDILLSAPPPQYSQLGIERFLEKRAKASSKSITGLESTSEHNGIFSGLTDTQAESLLLVLFINAGRQEKVNMFDAWRRGDTELLARKTRESFNDFPFMADRLLDARNRNWIPKIEDYLRSGQTYFVVVGAAHMGGPNGLLSLLGSRGYKIQQL
ncbi:MAG: TraB/GumN family protein [Verrucomicrobia bacterium]|nr:TraB/GumN family protein [Verrucomicrobiota bacterium]